MAKGVSAVTVSIADAQRDLARQKRRRADPPPMEARDPDGEGIPGRWEPNHLGLPREPWLECPVQPIGHGGGVYYLIDSAGEFRAEPASFFNHAGIQDLFAACPNYPKHVWPRWRQGKGGKPEVETFRHDAVKESLFLACTRKGLFSPEDKMRGRGGWTLRGGQFIYHAGEELWVLDGERFKVLETGLIEGHLYPRLAPLPTPWTERIRPADNPVRVLIETFRKWHWTRPEIDPVLLLGWVGVAYLGAALEWRSAIMLTGDKGTGKSTLQQGLRDLFGDALLKSGDTTAAGIYQKMKQDARPVAVDELEADADMRKVQAVIKLMRIAASGDTADRGGSDHQGVSFTLRSGFLFSAINNPLQSAQDLSRVAVLRLRELDKSQGPPPPIDVDTCGRMVLSLLMRGWPRFDTVLQAYMGALAAGGHDGRGQKTYGTLLACAEILLGAELGAELGIPLSEDLAFWTEKLAADAMPEVEDSMGNWRQVITWLLTAQVQTWRKGTRHTVGQCLADMEEGLKDPTAQGSYISTDARRDLADTGLGLVSTDDLARSMQAAIGGSLDEAYRELRLKPEEGRGWLLAVPNSNPLVAKLYEGTQWAGSPGQGGPWKDALRQAPDGSLGEPPIVITDKRVNRVRIGGLQQRCSLIVLRNFHNAPER